MRGVFDQDLEQEEDEPPAAHRRDREFTLGPMLLLGLFFGLALLCGLSFGLGYTLGGRNARATAPAEQQPASAPLSAANAQSKPTASAAGLLQSQTGGSSVALNAVTSLLPGATAANSAAPGAPANPAANAGPANPATQTPDTQMVVKPAFPAAQTSAPSQQPDAPALMVQIATVSQQEDAEALVGALRQRGYAVTVRRDPPQGAFHVEVGPFARRADALAMRQKLLHDGYNASLQP